MGDAEKHPFLLSFNRFLRIGFQGSRVISNGALILVRELDKRREFSSAKHKLRTLALIGFALIVVSAAAFAQTDEIQVYDATIDAPGKVSVTVHSNFTPIGRKAPAFPGAIIANDSVNGGVEWAFGIKPWFEQGLYLPVYTAYSKGRGGSLDGFKIRELFVLPHAGEHTLFYGVNFEFSFNYSYWESRHFTSEVRPIIGVNLHQWELVYNPIVDTDYTGGMGGLEFVPAGRVAYNINNQWAIAAEEYSDFGPLRHFYAVNNQFQEVWAVLDHNSKAVDIETGVGVGVTDGADKLTLKLMISHDFN